ncbi:MAG: hypothetical protein PHD25_12350 [Bacteroidales bacterium]|nr:hypothetical protein [Bacteroidales bacterium]
MDWKTEQEWLVMRYFRENDPDFPKGRLVKSESPDFKLWIAPGRFIGIELTRIRPPSYPDPVPGFLDFRYAWQQFISTLESKEKKTDAYRKQNPCSLWLIIFADYSEAHAIDRIFKTISYSHINTKFDRIHFFDLDQHLVFSLK